MSTQVKTEMFWANKIPEFHSEVQNLSPKELRLIRGELLVFIEQAQVTESSKTYVIFRPSNGGQFAIANDHDSLERFAKMIKKNYPIRTWSEKKHRGSCALKSKDQVPFLNSKNAYGRGRWA